MDWLNRLQANKQHAHGDAAEQFALQYLQRQGCILVERNFRCKVGEIDLIVQHQQDLVFVEVKYRQSHHYGSAASFVTTSKQRKIIKAAQHFLLTHKQWQNSPCRFDVVAVEKQPRKPHIEWLQSAFLAQS